MTMWTKTEDKVPDENTLVVAAWRGDASLYRMVVLR